MAPHTEHTIAFVIRQYLDQSLGQRDLLPHIAETLAEPARMTPAELAHRLRHQTPLEREALWRRLEGYVPTTQLEVCGQLLAKGPVSPSAPPIVPAPTIHNLAALFALLSAVKPAVLPSLCLAPLAGRQRPQSQLIAEARAAVALAEAVPGWLLALLLTPDEAAYLLGANGPSRLSAALSQHRIDIAAEMDLAAARDSPDDNADKSADATIDDNVNDETASQILQPEVHGVGAAVKVGNAADDANNDVNDGTELADTEVNQGDPQLTAMEEIRRVLIREQVPASLIHTWEQAKAHVVRETENRKSASVLRSKAEAVLYEHLQQHPETKGLFTPNKKLDFRFGPRVAEVDFVALSLRIAIEVDGYYHFRSNDDFRRDRRKDFLLQSRGFLVIRCLADDVIARIDEVMDLILQAVHHRCRRNPEHVTNR